MKVLSLGLDSSIVDKQSDLARRVLDYGALTEKYIVIIPAAKNEQIDLSDKVEIFTVGGCGKFLKLFRIYNLAKKILRQEKFDVISVQDIYYLALAAVILAQKNKIGLEFQVHGWEKFYGLRRVLAGFVLRRANAIRAVSQRLKKQLVEKFNLAEEKITVVPIFTDINIGRLKDNGKKDKSRQVFLAVGRLVPIKNITLQIEAMAEITKKYSNAELWVVGDGPEFNNLKIKIKKLKLEESVKLLGQKTKEELNEIYSQADVFILTSDLEGWGLAVIEAASYGLPIIMTDVGCAGEVIKNNESGIVVPIGGKLSLIQAMETLLRDEALRQRIGEGARQAVEALPSKQETVNLYLASWRKAMDRK